MARYRADTFQCAPAIQTQQLARYRTVAEKLRVTSFFIYRATCLWDAVGYFLGSLAPSPGARSAGAGGLSTTGGLSPSSNRFK